MQFPGFTRPMQTNDQAAVETLLMETFPTGDGSKLVENLRRSNNVAGEMVIPLGEAVIGYYALSKMRAPNSWLCLALIAIHPDYQRRGHGRRMLGQLTEWAQRAGQMVVVLGEPAFFARGGFDQSRTRKLTLPDPGTQALLAGPGESMPNEALLFPKAFDTL